MLDENLIQKIDQVRSKGYGKRQTLDVLRPSLGDDAEEALNRYERTPLPDGRTRDQVNFGDPAEWE